MGTQTPRWLPAPKGDGSQEPDSPVYVSGVPAGLTRTCDPPATMFWHHQYSLESRDKEVGEGDPEPTELTLIELTRTHFLLLAEKRGF